MSDLDIRYWSLIIQAVMGLITALIGISGVMVGHLVLARAKKREALTAFWEKYAITDGIEPLLLYTGNLEERIGEAYFKVSRPDGQWDEKERNKRVFNVLPLPYIAMHRVVELTSCIEVMTIIMECESYLEFVKDEESAKEISSKILNLNVFLRHVHRMFTVSAVESRSDVTFASSRKAMHYCREIFKQKIHEGKVETPDEILKQKALTSFNIFGTSKSERDKVIKSLTKRKGEAKKPEPPNISS